MDTYIPVYKELKNLYFTDPEIFNLLCRNQKTAPYKKEHVKTQLENKFLENINTNEVKVLYRIYKYDNCYFTTDYKTNTSNQVFSPYDEEVNICAPFYTSDIKKGQTILEIGTGCGLYSILSAKKGGIVKAVDVNKKAVQYAEYNALMNSTGKNITFQTGTIKSILNKNLSFDVIIASLPYMPWPPDTSEKKMYSDGGEYGCNLSMQALNNDSNLLNHSGHFKMYTMKLKDSHSPYMGKNPHAFFNHNNLNVSIKKLYSTPTNFIEWYKNKFPKNNDDPTLNWLTRLKENNLYCMHYITLEIKKAESYSLTVEQKSYDKNIAYPYLKRT